jgi:hypothetical protein
MQDMKVVRTVVGVMTASNAQGMRYRERLRTVLQLGD